MFRDCLAYRPRISSLRTLGRESFAESGSREWFFFLGGEGVHFRLFLCSSVLLPSFVTSSDAWDSSNATEAHDGDMSFILRGDSTNTTGSIEQSNSFHFFLVFSFSFSSSSLYHSYRLFSGSVPVFSPPNYSCLSHKRGKISTHPFRWLFPLKFILSHDKYFLVPSLIFSNSSYFL